MIDYTPTIFLRCHSRTKNDAADGRTGVWHCAFEPFLRIPRDNSVFASCGGNSVCIIDAKDATIKTKHYSKNYDENFHALAWTSLPTLQGRLNILAVAGLRSTLHLLHPEKAVCFGEYDLLKSDSRRKPKDPIESLVFHPGQPRILFGAFTSGAVHVWDIGTPCPPLYESDLETVKILHTKHCAYALTFSADCGTLLCATAVGAVCWTISGPVSRNNENFKQRTFHFQSTYGELSHDVKDFVDSIEAIGSGKTVASKCALHGCIYIWDLQDTLENQSRIIKPLRILKWSSTDNFYMNIGVNARGSVLACGDDKGSLWIYDIERMTTISSKEHDCSNIIAWPKVQGSLVDRRIVHPSRDSDIVVNKVALSYDAKFLVAVTNTNIVCIWKKSG